MAEIGGAPTLRTYLTVLRRRKWWVILIALMGLGVSLAAALSEPKQYSATAQLLVQSSNQPVTLGGSQPAADHDGRADRYAARDQRPRGAHGTRETGQRPAGLRRPKSPRPTSSP